MKIRALLFGAACIVANPAFAEWDVRVEGPDVFGNTKVMAGTAGASESMVVQCDQKEEFFIAYIFKLNTNMPGITFF